MVAELVDAFRCGQVFEPVLAEIPKLVRTDEITRRLRNEHLPAVADRGDARCPVNIDSDIALLRQERLACVESNSHANWTFQCALRIRGRSERLAGTREGNEEGIALGVHLDTTVPRERIAQRVSMRCKLIRVCVTELVQQTRRALDVREQEGDGAGWKISRRHSRLPRA